MSYSFTLRNLAKDLNLGVLLYKIYYAPKRFLNRCLEQGFINIATDNLEKWKMEQAAYELPTIPKYPLYDKPLEIYFLSGKNFWYQTCFCAYSMIKQAKVNIRPIIYDDGTLTAKYVREIQRIFPDAKIILWSETKTLLNELLPVTKFPYLRERHLNYPNIRKLIDIHLGSSGWKLVLDSDMLFFQNPEFLIYWLKSPDKPCYMIDTERSYGYSEKLMVSLAGNNIPEKLNVGICGLKSEDIDWEKLEFWCKKTIEQEGKHYYQEQALTAMLLANQTCSVAPANDYVVMPDKTEGINPKAVLHHYVANSKSWYFRYGWKRIINLNN